MRIRSKKSFTLIELLIVVAIIGILAGVGIPMYNGYMSSAKISAVKTNEANMKSYMAASFTKCSSGSTSLEIGVSTRSCSLTTRQLLKEFISYFNTINKNPYGLEGVARHSGYAEPDLGYTNFRDYGNRITIISNIGKVDGGNEFTTLDSISRE
tara:strand:- start:1397 stop:1858 length:462 start_codon:yes stop_codon:yes gene_type:complete